MSKQLLVEVQTFNPKEPQVSSNGNLVVEGILATAEVKNGNGRYYPRALWEREMQKYESFIKERRALGELDHPDQAVVNLKNVSHTVVDYWWEGDKIIGRIEILPTPSGNILKELVNSKIPLGVSSRGLGSLEQNGEVMEVQNDFALTCFDFVSTPSNPGSYFTPINESLDLNTKIQSPYAKVNELITQIICTSTGTCLVC